MKESQNIEYKQSWQDDYLKWICGFANAHGGSLFIGIDDSGKVVGVSNAPRLLEELPNKVRDLLGIIVEVNLHNKNGFDYIEVVIPPYSVPVSLRGRYYIRVGSSLQELKGNALNDFLLKKSGKSWDDVLEPKASFKDIDEKSVSFFLKAAFKSGRLTEDESLEIQELFEKLRLSEGNNIKRAAIILFGKDPGKFYPNLSIKIGRFGQTDDDLKFEEIEEGNLIQLVREVPAQLNRKFFIKPVDFEGLQRIEKGEYPVAAIREMLLNALVHRDYMGSCIQIRVYDDKFCVWNEGTLPQGLTLDSLRRQHPSRPHNPIIADVCFKGGFIDAWGRGTLKIINACRQAELPEPEIIEQDGGILVTVLKDKYALEQLKRFGLSERQIKAIAFIKENGKIINSDYQNINDVSERTALRDLEDLFKKEVLSKKGEKKGTYYILKND